jgi:phosphatidylglycerophosphate synthase
VTSPKLARREIVARLSAAQKSNRGAGGYSRWVNRPLGRQIAAVAYLADLTPNQVSVISAAFTFPALAALAIFKPTWVIAVAVPLALLIGYAFDSADGQLARLRGGGTPAGEWLDHVLDALKVSSFHLVIAISWFRFYSLEHPPLLLIPLGFAVVSMVFFFTLMLTDMLRRVERSRGGGTGAATATVNPKEPAPFLRSLIALPSDYGLQCLALLLIAEHNAFITVYAVLLVANAVFLVAGCQRWFREMSELGSAA